jgi:hypothetical protein
MPAEIAGSGCYGLDGRRDRLIGEEHQRAEIHFPAASEGSQSSAASLVVVGHYRPAPRTPPDWRSTAVEFAVLDRSATDLARLHRDGKALAVPTPA